MVCGGDWFREGDFYEVHCDEAERRISKGPLTVGICLCGSPWKPSIGGLRGGKTPNTLVTHFVESQDEARKVNDYAAVARVIEELARQDAFEVLRSQVKVLERAIARRKRLGRGRPWALPTRKATSKGRDQLVLAVEQHGFTARESKKAVAAFWTAMANGLQYEGFVQTPLGVFRVERPDPVQRRRFGREQVFYRLPRIVFRPDRDLVRALNLCIEFRVEEARVPEVDHKKDQLCCEICGSVEFMEAEFKQYRQRSASMPGDDISPLTEGIRVRICMCGNPIQPSLRRQTSVGKPIRESFQKSFEMARAWRESTRPNRIIERLRSEAFVTKQAHDLLAEEVAKLKAIIAELPLQEKPSEPASSS